MEQVCLYLLIGCFFYMSFYQWVPLWLVVPTLILSLIFNRPVAFFALFYFISWFALMWIFNFSTYHRYFKYAVAPLIVYSILLPYIFIYLGFEPYSLYLIMTFGYMLSQVFYKLWKEYWNLKTNPATALATANQNPQITLTREELIASSGKTALYYGLSVFIFLFFLVATFRYINPKF